jgi:hypothetical protein
MIDKIREKMRFDQFEFSKHAVDQTIIRKVSLKEIKEVIALGEIIEEYPDDKYGPSCLLLGKSGKGRVIHIQCSFPTRELIKIITLYEPEIDKWIDYRKRRK